MNTPRAREKKNVGGRPPKFHETRRPVTVTLPERILSALETVDKDRARAIVRVTETVTGTDNKRFKPVELVEVLPGRAIILVGPCAPLRQVQGLNLVEITPVRYLLTIPPGTPMESLEVSILDVMESTPNLDERERAILVELRDLLATHRRESKMTKGTMLFLDTARKR
ncbi:MAG: hypothetical protein KJ726_07670 [Verrucomicrobia bacterium]|nr:hypothetical protein [Verrucomicrobiota bacterium]MBU1909907.1 hypothetical protein [Verrucomicrobiota bacterium]